MARYPIRRIIAVLCLAVVMVPLDAGVASAFGYTDSGADPDDRAPIGFDPDIRSTIRTVWESSRGRRFLTIKFRAYEDLGLYWFVDVDLDSRGGPRRDFRMELRNVDQSGKGCSIWEHGHPDAANKGLFHQKADAAWCRVRLRIVHRTKRIRWRLVSPSGYKKRNIDHAPNGWGWYV